MRILITGGTGFIGKHLIIKLLEEGHNLLALTRFAQESNIENNLEKLQWIQTSLILNEECFKVLKDFKPEIIIHLAWENIPDFTFETSLQNLQNQVAFFKKICQFESINKIIVSGSCWEYNTRFGACNESEHVRSENYFTWAKNSFREFLEIECKTKGFSLYWARIFYVFGPDQRHNSLIPMLVSKIKNKERIVINNPNNSCDYIYIEDLILGINKLVHLNSINGIYNLGSGKSTKVIDIIKMVEIEIYGNEYHFSKNLNLNIPKEHDFWADISKSQNVLNWRPIFSLQEGIKKYIKNKLHE